MENAGFFGEGISEVPSLSILEISNIEGLSAGLSCTHNRAICIHLVILEDEVESSSDESTNSWASPSFHFSYA